MEEIPSKKCHIAEALVYTALIGILISRAFLIELRKVTKTAATIPFERWAVVWGTIAADLLAIVLRPYRDRTTEKYLTVMIRREAFDPQ